MTLPEDRLNALAGRVRELEAERDRLKREIGIKDRALHARNIALDGMAWVWCDGGCRGGVFRFCNLTITPETLAMIERNTERLKRWVRNRDYRALALKSGEE